MIIEKDKKTIVQSHDFESVNCTIDAEDMRYVASLLRNNYSNTQLAVIREISANALDANVEANSKKRIEVTLPSTMNPVFAVRDFGGGLSQEDVFGLYSKYGKSTKRESNNYIGAFGIGKFAPLSYGDNFTCVSYHGGKKTAYNIFVNEEDDTKIVKLNEESTSEPTGLCIEVSVSDQDVSSFRDKAQNFFEFFSDEEMPKFIGVDKEWVVKREKILESHKDSWFILKDNSSDYYNHTAHIIMGRVSYPLDRSSIQVRNLIDDERKCSIMENLLSQSNFYLRLPLGAVKLHHSRESVEYNKSTQKTIIEALSNACDEVQEIAKEKLSNSADLWEAKRNHAQVINSMPYGMRSIFENAFEWNGIKIESAVFNRPWSLQDELVITHTWKQSDSDSRDGYKCRSQKQTHADCSDNAIFVIQDIDSSHGNSLRARTLFSENDHLESVFFIHPTTKTAKDHINDEWRFDLIDKSHIKYSSNIEKQKVSRSVAKRGSRAGIPLFRMPESMRGYHHTNQSYWENVSDSLFDVDDSSTIEGSSSGQVLYVPIKNYKVVGDNGDFDEEFSLEVAYKAINLIKSSNDKYEDVRLYGVRYGDSKKLNSDWVNLKEFYIYWAKEYLSENMEFANNAYSIIKFDRDKDALWHENFRLVGDLFDNKNFAPSDNLVEDHIACVLFDINQKLNFETDHKLSRAIYLLMSQDQLWLDENMTLQFNIKDISNQLKIFVEDYPLLTNLYVSRYGDLEENDFRQNIIGYIKMCDQLAQNQIAVKKTA